MKRTKRCTQAPIRKPSMIGDVVGDQQRGSAQWHVLLARKRMR